MLSGTSLRHARKRAPAIIGLLRALLDIESNRGHYRIVPQNMMIDRDISKLMAHMLILFTAPIFISPITAHKFPHLHKVFILRRAAQFTGQQKPYADISAPILIFILRRASRASKYARFRHYRWLKVSGRSFRRMRSHARPVFAAAAQMPVEHSPCRWRKIFHAGEREAD